LRLYSLLKNSKASAFEGAYLQVRALQALKQSVARRLIARRPHFWQARYYDFNVSTAKKRMGKLRYMHRKSGEARAGRETGRLGVE
jgi:hypothetical protein